MFVCSNSSAFFVPFFFVDFDTRGLERGSVQRYGSDLTVRCPVLRGPYDVWKLCPL